MKKIAQILGGIIYTALFSAVLYILIVFPILWILDLPKSWGFVVILLFAGVIQGLIGLVESFAIMPYHWLLKQNIVSTILSIGMLGFLIVRYIIIIWEICHGDIIFAIVLSVLLVETLVFSIIGMIGFYSTKDQVNENHSKGSHQATRTDQDEMKGVGMITPEVDNTIPDEIFFHEPSDPQPYEEFPPIGSIIEYSYYIVFRPHTIKPALTTERYTVMNHLPFSMWLQDDDGNERSMTADEYTDLVHNPQVTLKVIPPDNAL